MRPSLSVLVITYNHEKYIAQCIHSILNQSFSNFELIIIDDGSTDNTRGVIQQFNDPRISYHYQENMGPSGAANLGVSLSNTEYVSLISGDDMAYEGRLAIQYDHFLTHPKATIVFGRCDVINEMGDKQSSHPLQAFFDDIIYTDRYKFFNRFFFAGNCLNAATCMFRRSSFQRTRGFQFASLQLQDYMMWFEWLKQSELGLLDAKLAYYRVRDDDQNLSSKKNDGRMFFEQAMISENILDDLDIDFFKKAFVSEIKHSDFTSIADFELEKALLYLKHANAVIQAIGLKKLFYLLQDADIRAIYLKKYHMSFAEYYSYLEKIGLNQRYYDDAGCVDAARFLIAKVFAKIKKIIKKVGAACPVAKRQL